MKDMTLEQIQGEVCKSVYFTVLVDEAKYTSKKEQVVVAVRYCLNNGIHEEFVGIAEAQSLDADGLTDTIISQLRRIVGLYVPTFYFCPSAQCVKRIPP